jgi:hypothetical protein
MSDDLSPDGILFMKQWQRRFPETPPINYEFKRRLTKRWMRVYSLPDAQRYPNDKADWDILLARQNAVIDHLIPQRTPITWVWNWLEKDCHIFKSFDLTRLGVFQAADGESEYESWLMEDHWESGLFNVFLTMIAGEMMRAFIIAPDCLIAPYDGGMDIILRDPYTAHAFKRHFSDWVSPREDGH